MVEFQISAPGKITLFGEHAFLHGKDHLLAASINLRTTLKFTELSDLSDSQDVIKIEFSHIGLSVNIPLQQFLNHFCGDEQEFAGSSNLLHSLTKKFVLLDSKKLSLTQQKNLNIFLYLLASVTYYEQIKIKSFHVHLSTLLPTDNEGLGTTMSSAVCLAACFLHWSCLQKNAAQDAKFDKNCLEKISKYAQCQN
ncbi:mevalonate kinase-like [Pogonomyrmex barbatus]|uniref:Mevalonate kinase-like n=1 Tax=Pogonomyrmex barbatus TaxID=144034 RepID=A0A6I9WJP8_9HYME|nr:mevalonate kinase-like [Pogonomyrmex barbatus]